MTKQLAVRPMKNKVAHPCRHCGAEGYSYYTHPMWFYAPDYEGKAELFWYCAKHPNQVFQACPSDVRFNHTQSGRCLAYPELKNEMVLHVNRDIAVGSIATKLLDDPFFPREGDYQIVLMADKFVKTNKTEYLIYTADGSFKDKCKKYEDACKKYDPRHETLVYIGPNNYYTGEDK